MTKRADALLDLDDQKGLSDVGTCTAACATFWFTTTSVTETTVQLNATFAHFADLGDSPERAGNQNGSWILMGVAWDCPTGHFGAAGAYHHGG